MRKDAGIKRAAPGSQQLGVRQEPDRRAFGHPRVIVFGLAFLLLAILWLIYLAVTAHQGLTADFGLVRPDGVRETVALTETRAVWYPSFWQILVPYLASWDEARWGFPAEVPRLDIEWTGIFSMPRPARIAFYVAADGTWDVQIGSIVFNSDSTKGPREALLPAGDHQVRITLKGNTDKTHIKLYQVLAGGRRIPARSGFFPSVDHKRAHRLTAAGAALLVVGVAVAGFLLRGLRRGVAWDSFQPSLRTAAVALLLALAFGLRLHERSLIPWPSETADEYYGAWAGWSLVHQGRATSWSWYSPYRDARVERWFGHDFRIVTPYFDQPPLGFLLVGLWGSAAHPFVTSPSGSGPFFHGPPLGVLRILPISLSCISMLLILRLGERLFTWWAAFAGSLIYATTPMLVPLHRLLKEENLFTPLALGALVLALAARDRPSRRVLWSLGALCGLAVCVKFTAFFMPMMAAAILLTGSTNWRHSGVLHIVMGTAAGVAVLLLQAALTDWHLFWAVTMVQGSKALGFLTAARMIFDPRVVYNPFGPAWVWWMWLAAVPVLATRARPLALAMFTYLLAIAASSQREPVYGWYAIPLYALLAAAAGGELVAARSRAPVRFLFWVIFLACSVEFLQRLGTIPDTWHRVFFLASLPILWLDIDRSAARARLRAIVGWSLLLACCAINSFLSLNLPFIYAE